MYTLAELNQMDQAAFTQVLGAIFEHTPTIAQQVWHDRPFENVADLYRKMLAMMHGFDLEAKLALIRAHPDLGSKAKMAPASVQEQSVAGLNRLSPEEYDRFHRLNQTYREQFGFPFIIAVKNQTRASILAAFERRLQNEMTVELETAIEEIGKIAGLRLINLIDSSVG